MGRRFLRADDWKVWLDSRETDERRGAHRAPAEKPFPADAALIELVAPEDISLGTMPLREVIAQRRSRRTYSGEALSLTELSFLLWSVQGVRARCELPEGTATLRTVPSGGGLHTFETYLSVQRVTGLDEGLYRYLPLEHKLLPLRPKVDADELVDACLNQGFVADSAVTFIWTTTPYRMEWRYSIVAHKIIATDAGHMCQNLYLAAESIGCGACAIGAYAQEEMDALVGADGEDEFTVYVASVGRV